MDYKGLYFYAKNPGLHSKNMHVWKATYVETKVNGSNLGQKVEARKLPLLSMVCRWEK
jgi:hypothetical protein